VEEETSISVQNKFSIQFHKMYKSSLNPVKPYRLLDVHIKVIRFDYVFLALFIDCYLCRQSMVKDIVTVKCGPGKE
jgi:hypothetical protein